MFVLVRKVYGVPDEVVPFSLPSVHLVSRESKLNFFFFRTKVCINQITNSFTK